MEESWAGSVGLVVKRSVVVVERLAKTRFDDKNRVIKLSEKKK